MRARAGDAAAERLEDRRDQVAERRPKLGWKRCSERRRLRVERSRGKRDCRRNRCPIVGRKTAPSRRPLLNAAVFMTRACAPSNASDFGFSHGPSGSRAIRYRATPLLLKMRYRQPFQVK